MKELVPHSERCCCCIKKRLSPRSNCCISGESSGKDGVLDGSEASSSIVMASLVASGFIQSIHIGGSIGGRTAAGLFWSAEDGGRAAPLGAAGRAAAPGTDFGSFFAIGFEGGSLAVGATRMGS